MLFHVTGRIEDPATVPPLVDGEKHMSKVLQDEGFTRWAYRCADHPGVYMVVEADSMQAAEQTLQRLPFVSGAAMTIELEEILPA